MSYRVIGTCSLCGGQVAVPSVWMGVIPPEATCLRCGAVRTNHGPVIDMKRPATQQRITTLTETGKDK